MKRFTETLKWEDQWFRRLPLEMKALWSWLLDKCDNAGVIDPDLELASFQIGYQYPMDTLSKFGERVVKLPSGKHFIPKFIEFQYGQLSTECKAHNPVFLSLKKHGLEGYPKGIHTLQEEEEVKDKVKDTEKEEAEPSILPKNWSRLTIKERGRIKVNFNTPLMCRIGKWFRQKECTLWTIAEYIALEQVAPSDEDLDLIGEHYSYDIEKNGYRFTTISILLNNWSDARAKANQFFDENPDLKTA